jgi:hypothetical protein
LATIFVRFGLRESPRPSEPEARASGSLLTAEADLHVHLPSAGPFALFAVVDGAQTVLQAVQQQPPS